jgi:hypothetical protein
MARTRKPLEKPVIPADTCPYIDMVIDLTEKMASETDYGWRCEQETLVKALMEYVRESNQKLRISSKFWYEQYQKVSKN